MGERFLMYRVPRVDPDHQAHAALRHAGREAEMRADLSAAAASVLGAVDSTQLTAPPDDEMAARLVSLATLAVRCRSSVERDGHSREILLIPESEAPGRLAGALLRLHRGLRAIGVSEAETWHLVSRCALDSMPALRRAALTALAGRAAATTTEVAEVIGYPTQTTRQALEDLTAHGVLVRSSMGQGRADRWAVSEWARARIPTVPESAGGEAEATVPESAGVRTNGHARPTVPSSLSSERGGGFSGKVPDQGAGVHQAALDLTSAEAAS
jgi:hypothetical protein